VFNCHFKFKIEIYFLQKSNLNLREDSHLKRGEGLYLVSQVAYQEQKRHPNKEV